MSDGARRAAGLATPQRRRAPGGEGWGEGVMLAALALFVLVVAIWPLGRLVSQAVFPEGTPSLSLLSEALSTRAARRAAWHSLESSTLAAIGAVIRGARPSPSRCSWRSRTCGRARRWCSCSCCRR